MFAPQHRLDNLIAIVDYNKIQSLGRVKEVIDLDPLADKWRSFGWAVREIDGQEQERQRRDLDREASLFTRDQLETGAASRLIMRLGRD